MRSIKLVRHLMEMDEFEPGELAQGVPHRRTVPEAELLAAEQPAVRLDASEEQEMTQDGKAYVVKYATYEMPQEARTSQGRYNFARDLVGRLEEVYEKHCNTFVQAVARLKGGGKVRVAFVFNKDSLRESEEIDPEHLMRVTYNPWEALDDYGFKEMTIPLGLGSNWQNQKYYKGPNVTIRVFQKHGDYLVMFSDPHLVQPHKYRKVNFQLGTLAHDLKALADAGDNVVSAHHKFAKGSHWDINDDAGSFWMEVVERLFREFTYKVPRAYMYTFLGRRSVRLDLMGRGFHIMAVGDKLDDRPIIDELRNYGADNQLEGYKKIVAFLSKYRWSK